MAYRQALNPAVRAACSSVSSRSLPQMSKSILLRASFSSVSVAVNATKSPLTTRPSMTALQHRCLSDGGSEQGGGGGNVGFNFAGPQKLDEVLRIDLVQSKTTNEVQDLWLTYHETRPNIHGLILPGSDAKLILNNATKCPYFISPIFRDSGFFMLLSQFMSPNHFLLAYLEDYKLDPARAQPLISISIFDELVESHDLTLVRCDVINKAVSDHEAYRVVSSLVNSYKKEEEFQAVQTFNLAPDKFDVDDYISQKSQKWREDDEGGQQGGGESSSSSASSSHVHVVDANGKNNAENADEARPRS